MPASPSPSGLAQQILEGLLNADQPVQISIRPGKDLDGVALSLLLKDEERGNGLSEILFQGAFGPEDRALCRGGTGHGGIVGHEGGRLLPAVLDLHVDPFLLELLAEVEGLLVVAGELRPRRLLAAVVKLHLHMEHLRVKVRTAPGLINIPQPPKRLWWNRSPLGKGPPEGCGVGYSRGKPFRIGVAPLQ